jgi:hypothetical protein
MSRLDELLQPTLQDHTPDRAAVKPWHVGHQFWVAFIGGILAITVIAYLNSQRLRLEKSQQRLILGAGILGFILYITVIILTPPSDSSQRIMRFEQRILAVLVYVVMRQIQMPAFRAYMSSDFPLASLWKPGILATIILGILQALIAAGISIMIHGVKG